MSAIADKEFVRRLEAAKKALLIVSNHIRIPATVQARVA